jgi:hypothetical protein
VRGLWRLSPFLSQGTNPCWQFDLWHKKGSQPKDRSWTLELGTGTRGELFLSERPSEARDPQTVIPQIAPQNARLHPSYLPSFLMRQGQRWK